MNKYDLNKIRNENLNKIDRYAYHPKINAVEINIRNSFMHELMKFLLAFSIRKGVIPSQLQEMTEYVKISEFTDEFGDFLKDFVVEGAGEDIVTEARMKGKIRRVDVFTLTTGTMVEYETDPKVTKKGLNVITVRL